MLRNGVGLIVASTITLSGCATFSEYDTKDDVVPIIFRRLQCEIIEAKDKKIVPGSVLSDGNWAVIGTLSVDVNASGSIGSSPSMTNTYTDGSVTWAASPSISASKQQTFTYVFSMETAKIKPSDCRAGVQNEFSLRGDLGIVGAVRLATIATGLEDTFHPSHLESGALFSHQVEFTVGKSVGKAGPTWVIQQFSGVGLSFDAERTDKNNLLVAFTRIPEASAGRTTVKGRRIMQGAAVASPIYRLPTDLQLLFSLDRRRLR